MRDYLRACFCQALPKSSQRPSPSIRAPCKGGEVGAGDLGQVHGLAGIIRNERGQRLEQRTDQHLGTLEEGRAPQNGRGRQPKAAVPGRFDGQ
jgi:hypothetical protein